MASLQFDEQSRRWRIRFYYQNREYKRSLKTNSERQARGMLQRVEDTILFLEQGRLEIPAGGDPALFILTDGRCSQKKPAGTDVMTLGDLFSVYREKLTEGAKEKNTLLSEVIHIKHLERLIGAAKFLGSIRTADFQDYIDVRSREHWRGKRIKPQTIKKEIDTLRTIWSWAKRLGHVGMPAPIDGLTFGRQNEKPPFQTWAEIDRIVSRNSMSEDETRELWDCLFLSTDEINLVLEWVEQTASPPWLYPLFVFAAHTGARRSEVLRSQVVDFNFDGGWVSIREKKRKKGTATTRRIELTPKLKTVMQHYFTTNHPGGRYSICKMADVPLSPDSAQKAFRLVLRDSKWSVLKGYHVFRHSFASNLAAAGIDQRIIDEFMGHQTEAMRRRYRHLFPEQRRRAIEAVFR